MYSTSTNAISFYGKTKFLSCNSDGKARTVSDYPFGTAYFGETKGLSDFVKKHSYPAAIIEETVGKLHDNKTYKIYVTDPKEIVNDLIKFDHDYVVYDTEPNFPDIKLYFETKQEDISKGLKNVSEYYRRLENSSMSSGDIDAVNLSKEMQNVANMCFKIFDEGADLRIKRSDLELKIVSKSKILKIIEENLPKYRKELVRKKQVLARRERELPIKEKNICRLKDRRDALSRKVVKNQNSIDEVNSNIQRYEKYVLEIKNRIEKCKARIKYLEQYIESSPERILNIKADINRCQKEIFDIKEALIPNLTKLKEFYTVNGIKIIKHI